MLNITALSHPSLQRKIKLACKAANNTQLNTLVYNRKNKPLMIVKPIISNNGIAGFLIHDFMTGKDYKTNISKSVVKISKSKKLESMKVFANRVDFMRLLSQSVFYDYQKMADNKSWYEVTLFGNGKEATLGKDYGSFLTDNHQTAKDRLAANNGYGGIYEHSSFLAAKNSAQSYRAYIHSLCLSFKSEF